MLITRNNYETFFLLYADNELCAEEQLTVENFITDNEDLRGELDFILAAIVVADNEVFKQKDSLYKNSFVDGSLQEKLLLKVDNELRVDELSGLDKTLLVDQAAREEEQMLLATKLDAGEVVIYPFKELLYKKQRDTVVVFRMIRWAAAAVLIGFGLFFGFSVYNKNTLPHNTVAVKTTIKPANKIQSNTAIKQEQNVAILNASTKDETNNKNQKVLVATKLVTINKNITPKVVEEKILVVEQTALASNKEVKKVVSPSDNIEAENLNQTSIASITKREKVQTASFTNDNIVPLETTYAQAVSFTEMEKSNNKILYMDEEDVKRSKVGGVFKKFKRMIERTAKIKTGNPIRIAGFQIGTN